MMWSYSRFFFIPSTVFVVLSASLSQLSAQNLKFAWALSTESSISGSLAMDDDNIYFGNEDGLLICLSQKTEQPVWEFETNGNIQGKVLIVNDLLFVESANVFYMLYKDSGELLWKHDLQITPEKFIYDSLEYLYKLDPYDDIRPTGFAHKYSVFTGTTNGQLLEFDIKTGEIKRKIKADGQAPIRTTPIVLKNVVYFGDWNGKLYAYDLKSETFLWKTNSYEEKPYPTFGSIASALTVENDLLYFGARNPTLQTLSIENGNVKWSYTEKNGGWIIGDPVIQDNILYIGGSDNFSMMAFDALDGKLLWQNKRNKNIYTRPVITDEWVIYAAGDGYDKDNSGEVVILDRKTGKELAEYITPKGIFSSPVYNSETNMLYFGCMNGKLYALRVEE